MNSLAESEIIIFNHIKFRRYSGEKYYSPHIKDRLLGVDRLHREVWKFYNGEIPRGYVIHHKDFDSNNNNINNLECVSDADHQVLHAEQRSIRAKGEASLLHLAEIRELTKVWHRSKEGREWHKKHSSEIYALRVENIYHCEQCGKEFKTKQLGNIRFCSNNCKAKNRRNSMIDTVTRVCKYCSKEFTVNKYSKTIFCSKKCSKYKFSVDDMKQIQDMYFNHKNSIKEIVDIYNSNTTTIYRIVNSKSIN